MTSFKEDSKDLSADFVEDDDVDEEAANKAQSKEAKLEILKQGNQRTVFVLRILTFSLLATVAIVLSVLIYYYVKVRSPSSLLILELFIAVYLSL